MKEQQELETTLQELDRELEADSLSFPGRFPSRVWTLGARCALLYVLGQLESLELARVSETAPPPSTLTVDRLDLSSLKVFESVQSRLESILQGGFSLY